DALKSRAGRERSLEEPLSDGDAAELRDTANAEDRLLEKESRRLMLRALREVPPNFRAVVVMADVQGLGYEQVAGALELPIGTVKSRLKRGRDALRAALFRRSKREAP